MTDHRLMTLADLRHIATARAVRRAEIVQQTDGQYHLVLDIGPESVVLSGKRDPGRPRPFRSLDGVIGTLRELGVHTFRVALA